MKKVLTIAMLLFLLSSPSQMRAESRTEFVQKVYNSVVLLYQQTEDGSMKVRCTATAYKPVLKDKTQIGYRFVSASHCVEGETDVEQKSGKYFITPDAAGEKTFLPAKLIEAGDRKVGDDFSIFEVDTTVKFEIIPVGDSDKVSVGEQVVDVASPLGLGKQYFQGYVSSTLLDRPPLDAGDVQWKNVMLVQIGSGPGSSGSAVISEDQKAIIGFLVGGFHENIGAICLPANKFKTFEDAVDKGTYKKTPPKSEMKLF